MFMYMEYVYQIDNVLTKDVCEEIIKRFKFDNRKRDSAVGEANTPGIVNKDIRSSKVLNISGLDDWKDIDTVLFDSLNKSLDKYKKYLNRYTGHDDFYNYLFSRVKDEGYNIQYMKNDDFYKWHTDDSGKGDRFLTCIWYLNDVDGEDGGTTDFMFGKRIKPRQGSLMIFPATWTYIHRAAPIKNDCEKYTCITWLNKQ